MVRQNREIINPAFRVAVFKGKHFITAKVLRPGETLDFDGFNIVFSDFTYWVKFYIVGEYGLSIIYAGFALMTVALFVRFIFFRRDIRGFLEDGRLHISGRGEFYPALFDEEFAGLINNMRA
jgi:hypothetical protein